MKIKFWKKLSWNMVMYHSDKLEGHVEGVNVMHRRISSPTGEEDTDPFRPDGDYWIDGSPLRSPEEHSYFSRVRQFN